MNAHVSLAETRRQAAVERVPVALMRSDPQLRELVERAAVHYRTRYAAISIISRQRQLLIARVGIDTLETPRDESFCATAIQQPGETLVVADARQDSRFAHMTAVRYDPHVRFYAGVPLVDQSGFALGALCIADPQPLLAPLDVFQLKLLAVRAEALLRAGAA